MKRFTKILVPIDFSLQSDEAVRYAVALVSGTLSAEEVARYGA